MLSFGLPFRFRAFEDFFELVGFRWVLKVCFVFLH
jgi:hypothetical protein